MLNGKWKENFTAGGIDDLAPHSIYSINSLTLELKRCIYASLIPDELINRYHLDLSSENPHLDDYFHLHAEPGSSIAELSIFHEPGFIDPVMQGQITDTANGPLIILFFAMINPDSPRFDTDRLPDGALTELGTRSRNLQAEIQALQAGLAPGQVRSGLHMASKVIQEFETFVYNLGHEMYFVQPLYYHNAIIFEKAGFAYAKGRRLMQRINAGFAPDGEFSCRLDGSTPFRTPEAARSIRLRSWALHDGLLEEPFNDVTMYKQLGHNHSMNTCEDCLW